MVSTPERFTDNSKISSGPSMTVTNTSARKSLCLFTEVLGVKNKTALLQVGADKSKRKAIISGSVLWSIIKNSKGY